MRAVLTRVKSASVAIDGEVVGKDLPGGHSVFTVRFEVKNTAELETIRNRLMSIRDVMGSRRGQN